MMVVVVQVHRPLKLQSQSQLDVIAVTNQHGPAVGTVTVSSTSWVSLCQVRRSYCGYSELLTFDVCSSQSLSVTTILCNAVFLW